MIDYLTFPKRRGPSRRAFLTSLIVVLIFSFLSLSILHRWKAGKDKERQEEPIQPREEQVIQPAEEQPIPPQVAIIIDDLGHSLSLVESLLNIDYPLTLSILPGLRHSVRLAKEMKEAGFETILHLPLEPEEISEEYLELGTIMTGMSQQEVRELIEKHLSLLLPWIAGVNTHMGSKATADEDLMKIILEEIKKRDLYFIDSRTAKNTVAFQVAKSLGLRAAFRQVFLDLGERRDDPDYIRGQLRELASLARDKGKAIGTGHLKGTTLKVLKEMMPQLEEEGIQFVTASEIVE
ncbi:divergent polysaccharide deacetylase family protein [bacterium]|nr:divergent polysaccharide deacetylase family protein [bacterium]